MARLRYVTDNSEVASRIRRRRGGHLTPLDGMLLHSPPLADGWNSLLGVIRNQSTLPHDIRELAILRVAALNGAHPTSGKRMNQSLDRADSTLNRLRHFARAATLLY